MESIQTLHYPIHNEDLISIKACPLCNDLRIIPIAEVRLKNKLIFFSTGACQNCGFVFRTISPSYTWFQGCWRQIKTDSLEPFNPAIEKIREHRYGRYLNLIQKYKPSGSLLDIGAANGTGSALFYKHGYDVNCIEPEDNKALIIVRRHKLPLVSNDIEEFLSRRCIKQYDVVIFAHCLEHLDNPVEVMHKIRHAIKPDGLLYLEVPMLKNSVTWSDALYLTHKSNFTERTLAYLTGICGFEALEEKHFRHSRSEPLDFGILLRRTRNIPKSIGGVAAKDIESIRNLYRRGLPHAFKKFPAKILQYEVNAIEQFYCTLRLNHRVLKIPTNSNGYITFK
jgi:2-polyprenyl-3-methyl-5-hydroxy-6-metoxy-1,4-benzoquinol methylase